MNKWFLYLLIFLGSMKVYEYWIDAYVYIHTNIKKAYWLADQVGRHDYEYLTPDKKVIKPDELAEG